MYQTQIKTNKILSHTGISEPLDARPAKDGKPYTVLMYGNGPGYSEQRENLTGVDISMLLFLLLLSHMSQRTTKPTVRHL